MGYVPMLGQMATTVTVHNLLKMNDAVSVNGEAPGISLLRTNLYTAVSGSLLEYIVQKFPRNLTSDLLEVLVPPHLRTLSLKRCRNITALGIEKLFTKCTRLERLDLSGVDQLMRPTFFQLCGLIAHKLTSITLDGNDSITDECVQVLLWSLPNLEMLSLAECDDLTDDMFFTHTENQHSWDVLSQVTTHRNATQECRLSSVNISGCRNLTSTSIDYLTARCGPTLTRLDISFTKIDCTALLYLSGYNISGLTQMLRFMDEGNLAVLLEDLVSCLQACDPSQAADLSTCNNAPIGGQLENHPQISKTGPCGSQKSTTGSIFSSFWTENSVEAKKSLDTSHCSECGLLISGESRAMEKRRTQSCPDMTGQISVCTGSDVQMEFNDKPSVKESWTLHCESSTGQSECGKLPGPCQNSDVTQTMDIAAHDLDQSPESSVLIETGDEQGEEANDDVGDEFFIEDSIKVPIENPFEVPLQADCSLAKSDINSGECCSQVRTSDLANNSLTSMKESHQTADAASTKMDSLTSAVIRNSTEVDTLTNQMANLNCSTCGSSRQNRDVLTKTIENRAFDNCTELSSCRVQELCTGRPCVHEDLRLLESCLRRQRYKPKLMALDISDIDMKEEVIGNACLKVLCLCNPHLRQLTVSWKELQDDMLCYIMEHQPCLCDLTLSEGSQITTGGMARMSRASPNISKLNLQGVSFIGDEAVWSLTDQLTVLNLAETSITDRLLMRIAEQAAPKLVELDLSWCEEVTVDGLNAVARNCTSLKSLSLRQNGATDHTITLLAHNCTQLKKLVMPSVANITDHALLQLALNLYHLQELDISWNISVTDDGVETLLTHCGSLHMLNLAGVKRLTIKPFLPIIAERERWRRCQALLQLKLHEQKLREKTDEEQVSSDEEYEDLFLPQRSLVYAACLRWLDLEYCDRLDDGKLSEIVAVCRGTLIIRDYYSELVKPAYIACHSGKVFLSPH